MHILSFDLWGIQVFERLRKALGHQVTLQPRPEHIKYNSHDHKVVGQGWVEALFTAWTVAKDKGPLPTVEASPRGGCIRYEDDYLKLEVGQDGISIEFFDAPRESRFREHIVQMCIPGGGGVESCGKAVEVMKSLWGLPAYNAYKRLFAAMVLEFPRDEFSKVFLMIGEQEKGLPPACKKCGHAHRYHCKSPVSDFCTCIASSECICWKYQPAEVEAVA